MSITVNGAGGYVEIERRTYTALFDNSVLHARRSVQNALEKGSISLEGKDGLLDLARRAEIPYPLFFAPFEHVQAQITRQHEILLRGISKDEFSLNSRHEVQLRDVQNIVRDLLRKQAELKRLDPSIPPNRLIGALNPTDSATEGARKLEQILGFTSADLRAARSREEALELLIDRFEQAQVFVSRSQVWVMPQNLYDVRFSGLTIKDKKIPYIFLTSGEAGENLQPRGRQILTLVLLAALIGYRKFMPVTYDDTSRALITNREYLVAEEVLMPRSEFRAWALTTLDDLEGAADHFRVTPSAVVMRGQRLGKLSRDEVDRHLTTLSIAFAERPKGQGRPSKPVNAVRKYASAEYSRRMLTHLDAGRITLGDFLRIVCLKKIGQSDLRDFAAAMPRIR